MNRRSILFEDAERNHSAPATTFDVSVYRPRNEVYRWNGFEIVRWESSKISCIVNDLHSIYGKRANILLWDGIAISCRVYTRVYISTCLCETRCVSRCISWYFLQWISRRYLVYSIRDVIPLRKEIEENLTANFKRTYCMQSRLFSKRRNAYWHILK